MSNAPATNHNEPKKQDGARQPIAIERLLVNHSNPHGIKMPWGYDGKGEKILHTLIAGIEGDVKTEIDLLPWMQAFRVKRNRVVKRSGAGDKEILTFEPMGKAFYVPMGACVWVPVGE